MVNGRHYAIIPMDEYNEFIEWKEQKKYLEKKFDKRREQLGNLSDDIPF